MYACYNIMFYDFSTYVSVREWIILCHVWYKKIENEKIII
jgi:hypothetical protein